MSEKEQNTQSDFMIEKIKQRPINRKKLLRRTIITASSRLKKFFPGLCWIRKATRSFIPRWRIMWRN